MCHTTCNCSLKRVAGPREEGLWQLNTKVRQPREQEYSHIKQELIDCLIATRSAYEPDNEGAEFVLKQKNYELKGSELDLLFRSESSSMMMRTTWKNQVYVMVRSSAGYIIVACRGSFSLSDFIADVNFAKVPLPFAKGKAHRGFLERAMNMPLELFLSLLRAGENIVFTGHSMGGAVASLAALRVLGAMAFVPRHLSIALKQVRCITFGTAAFGNLELAAYVNSRYKNNFHHVVSKHDVVPRIHNIFPQFFFPLASWLVHSMHRRWEVRFCKNMIESMTKMSVDKALLKLEEKLPALGPATGFYSFVRECAAYNEEALAFGHSGLLLLLNPDAKDPELTIVLHEMESLGMNFGIEDKRPLEIYFEHGLGNHYSCLVRGLRNCYNTPRTDYNVGRSENHCEPCCSCSRSSELKLKTAAPALTRICARNVLSSLRQLLKNPSAALCQTYRLVNRFFINVTGNEFPCAQLLLNVDEF